MNNDLISRETVKKEINNLYNETLDGLVKFGIEKAYKEIDKAPAVEINKLILNYGRRNGKIDMMLNALRPHGEWLLNKDDNPECPFCHHCFSYWGNFCSNCGADMRGGADNE